MPQNDTPRFLYTSQAVKALDKLAVEKLKITAYQLMCRAGEAAFSILTKRWPTAKSIAVFCGSGNNGGDGLVLARLAKKAGLTVNVYQVGDVNKLSEEAQLARTDWEKSGGKIIPFAANDITADVIVDALLGTGTRAPLAMPFQQAINAINLSKRAVLAIDLPSGLNVDQGVPLEVTIQADLTITFVGMKIGLLTGEAINFVGELFFDDLGVNDEIAQAVQPLAESLNYRELIKMLPVRKPNDHKGDHGHVLIIGAGHTGYAGAVCLAGEAALRAGSGLVSAVVAPESLPLMARSPAELMCYAMETPAELQALLARATVVVLGSGFGQTPWAEQFFKAGLKVAQPKVVDADGLNWLAKFPQKQQNWILTPHPGEAARLLGTTTQIIQHDRIKAAQQLREKFGGVIVLKGAGTIILDQEDHIYLNAGGFAGLASGGTGDVLAGLIGGLLAQGLSLSLAARIGVNVHTRAAGLEDTMGSRGMIASDLLQPIRHCLNPEQRLSPP
ncbi:MAG: NAD(P)H-hydrate dehydratase [Candidatus Berkiellales bacterium]